MPHPERKKTEIKRSEAEVGLLTAKQFGFEEQGKGVWVKETAGVKTEYRSLGWQNIPALEEVVDMQKSVWQMPDRELVPSNLLAIVGDTGGSILGAYDTEGKLKGFVFTVGSTSGKLILHMIGVDQTARFSQDLGWNLSVLQAIEAAKKGVKHIEWTYDPLRGSNARLNLEKLGAVPYLYTINKYGVVNSELYGEHPTDRFTVDWNISDAQVQDRIKRVSEGAYKPLGLLDVRGLPILNSPERLPLMLRSAARFMIEVPGDVDDLEPQVNAQWRLQVRQLISGVMSTEAAEGVTPGTCFPIGFATGIVEAQRKSYYVFKNSSLG